MPNNETPSVEENQPGEPFPLEPRYHPVNRVLSKMYNALASSRLAMVLLLAILACSVIGATVYRGQQANILIFNSLWFNSLLVLLVVNVACCFFGRIWGRRVTVVSFGMILFHLSFVAVFLGVAYNSLFYFRGAMRMTEGEVLRNSDPVNYDIVDTGRFFDYSRLRGETTLIEMHVGYKADGKEKRVAYEVEVGEGTNRKREIIYVTNYLEYQGVKYFRDKEGYSLLLVLNNGQKEEYGAFVPLQSYKQSDGTFHYAVGSKESETGMLFPQPPMQPLFNVQAVYTPSKLIFRKGDVAFTVSQLAPDGGGQPGTLISQGKSAIGSTHRFGKFGISPKEVRYWASMQVSYEPGQPIILSSLWVGLAGLIVTTVGRMVRRGK